MHTLRLKRQDGAQKIVVFWFTGLIQYVNLKYRIYKNLNIKVDYDANVMTKI